ncbi:hypothetical protein NW752_002804 [Fusarium irregulare]|uniref:Uncharacterized protein n=1 Tax=Fusarium irregulare TaxID=2494466 RepID=A0A9W8Q0H6_9HYPO|nr:hypothetical protein NW766_000469 [Fusarium irregulare]KAJ4025336.1 hypothetical protein NW752_002804 [Fusarium irregulare]
MERLAKHEIGWADVQLQTRHIREFTFYIEASYMWTVFNRCNMNVDKILARRRVQPEPATAEITTEGHEANQDDEFHHVLLLSPFSSVSHLGRQQPTFFLSYSLPPPPPSILPMAPSPSTPESTERFLPPSGTSFEDFSADSDVIKPREPDTPIRHFFGLSPAERWALGDHLRLWLKVVDQMPAEARDLQITAEHRRRFGMKLFDDWNTSHGTSEIPESPTKETKEHSRIPVSVWSQDLPPSGAAKRKRDDDDDDDKTPSPKKPKCSPARKKGAKAYVSVTKTIGKGDDKITFEFKDANSQLTTGEFIAFDHPNNLAALKAQSLMQHDSIEVSRTRTFNEELIITSARNWIVEAANVGLKSGSDSYLNSMGEHQPVSGVLRIQRIQRIMLMYH